MKLRASRSTTLTLSPLNTLSECPLSTSFMEFDLAHIIVNRQQTFTHTHTVIHNCLKARPPSLGAEPHTWMGGLQNFYKSFYSMLCNSIKYLKILTYNKILLKKLTNKNFSCPSNI